MRIELQKRRPLSPLGNALVALLAVPVALLFSAVLLSVMGVNAIQAYITIFQGAFGSTYVFTEVLVKATPLMLAGLGLALAFRANYWNIGAEGQLVMGGFAATGIALFWAQRLPAVLIIPIMIVAAFVGGGLWGLIAAALKVWSNVNEIISTLMLNYIAILWAQYLYFDAWKNSKGFGFPGTAEFPKTAWLPKISGQLHIGVILALLAALVLFLLLAYSKWGYELRIIGGSVQAARYAGISLIRNVLLVALVSGGLAGLAGLSEVAGVAHKLENGISVGYGYTAIIVAFLGRLSSAGVIVAALFIAALTVGCEQLQVTLHLPVALAQILQGVILLFVLAAEVASRYRLRITRTAQAPVSATNPAKEL